MYRELIGQYLGRAVELSQIDWPADSLQDESLSTSLVMVCLGRCVFEEKYLNALIQDLVSRYPLGITLFGHNSATAFSHLLQQLSTASDLPHIMTKLSNETHPYEAIRDFLEATWPSDERYVDWTSYVILLVGNCSLNVDCYNIAKVITSDKSIVNEGAKN